MRRPLDRLYAGAFAAAGACFAAIAVLTLVRIVSRLIDRAVVAAGWPAPGIALPALTEIGGFLFTAAVFLGLAGTLHRGGHVRVALVAQRLGPRAGRWLGLGVVSLALVLAVWATWSTGVMVRGALAAHRISHGVIAVPLALPQAVMTLGLAVFAVALADAGWALLRGHEPAFRAAERASDSTGDAGGPA